MQTSLAETPQTVYKSKLRDFGVSTSLTPISTLQPLLQPPHFSPQKPPVRIRTNTASPSRDEKTKKRFELQNAAARLLPQERVAKCLRDLAYNQTSVKVMYSPEVDAAHFKGLMVCASVWTCPVCASKITELRRQELTQIVAAIKAKGWGVAMATETQRHKKYENCPDLLEAFKQATRRFKSGKRWQALKTRYGYITSINALEVTHTQQNGWHVHAHEMMVFDHVLSGEEIQAAKVDFKHLWVKVAAADWEHGFDLKAGFDAVGDYIAKFGREPKNAGWTLEHEITKSNVKQAAAGGRTPFGLLDDYNAGDLEAGELFVEYAKAFKGRRQLQGVAKLKKLLGLDETDFTDEELAESVQADAVVVMELGGVLWGDVLHHVSRWEILAQVRACKGDPDAVWSWLLENCCGPGGPERFKRWASKAD